MKKKIAFVCALALVLSYGGGYIPQLQSMRSAASETALTVDAGSGEDTSAAPKLTFSVTASSYLGGTDTSANLIDGNYTTSWMAAWVNTDVPEQNESVVLDFGSVKHVAQIGMQADKEGFPLDYKIQWSLDGEHYYTIEGFDLTNQTITDEEFKDANNTRAGVIKTFDIDAVTQYVKIAITKTQRPSSGGIYLASMAELTANGADATDEQKTAAQTAFDALVEGTTPDQPDPPAPSEAEFTLTVSSTLVTPGNEKENLLDGSVSTMWRSGWADEKNPVRDEWILLDFGEVRKVNSITMTPGYELFPADYSIEWSLDNAKYGVIEGFTFTGQNGTGDAKTYDIATVTRYVRISVTRANANADGNYMVGLAELSASVIDATDSEKSAAQTAFDAIEGRPVEDDPVIASTASASSYLQGEDDKDWGRANINDGMLSTQWCCEWGSGITEEACSEWLVLTFQTPQKVAGVIIQSQLSTHYCFPKSFHFQWTLNGTDWFDIEGASYENEPTDNVKHVKVFAGTVVATAIRMNITSSYPDGSGNYLVQIAEFQAHGYEATAEEVAAATAKFNELMGIKPEEPTVDTPDYALAAAKQGAVMAAFAVVAFAGAVGILMYILLGKKKTQGGKQ